MTRTSCWNRLASQPLKKLSLHWESKRRETAEFSQTPWPSLGHPSETSGMHGNVLCLSPGGTLVLHARAAQKRSAQMILVSVSLAAFASDRHRKIPWKNTTTRGIPTLAGDSQLALVILWRAQRLHQEVRGKAQIPVALLRIPHKVVLPGCLQPLG